MRIQTIAAALLLGGVGTVSALEQNLLRNGDFATAAESGAPAQWTVVPGQKVAIDTNAPPDGSAQALRVDIVKAAGESLGEIRQTLRAKPNTQCRLAGMVRATKPKMALLAIKLRKDGKETGRLSSAWNDKDWTRTTCEFASADNDEIQVLCRWRQSAKDNVVGQTVWFADLILTEIGSAPPVAGAAAAAEPWRAIVKQAASVTPPAGVALPLPLAAGDLHLTPDGAGERDGRDWANALPGNATGVLQAAWNAAPPGHAVRLGSGLYVNLALTVASGGTGPDALKRLTGEDTGGGLPWCVGDWTTDDLSHGLAFVALSNGVSHCAFEHLRLARYQYVIRSAKGRHVGLRIRDVNAYEFRYGIYLCGGALAEEPATASHDIEIADCEFVHFTKNGFRFQGGNYDVRLLNCVADAGGRPWMKESFHMGFSVQGDAPRRHFKPDDPPWASEHDFVFINCVARNCIYSEDRYWQGDGYCAERGVSNLVFINCAAYDCADGGWDLKAANIVYVNCVGLRNKKNFRIWDSAFFHNCLSANSFKRGGSWNSDGLWSIGNIHADGMTIVNNSELQIFADSKGSNTAAIVLERCLVGFDGVNGKAARLCSGDTRVTKVDSAEWQPKTDTAEGLGPDPDFVNLSAGKSWMGDPPDAFDSRHYGPAKGYHSTVAALWRNRKSAESIDTARQLLQHQGWDDFKRRIAVIESQRRQ